jgi:hypothetical protein
MRLLNRKFLKYIVLLNFIQFILVGIYYCVTRGGDDKSDVSVIKEIQTNPIANKKSRVSLIDTSSPRNAVWEQLNENVFFKRTSAFYIIERTLLRIFLVCMTRCDYNYAARIKIELNNDQIHHIYTQNEVKIKRASFGKYVWYALDFKLNLLDFINLNNYDELLDSHKTFHLYLSDLNKTTDQTQHYIDVQMKYIRSRPNKPPKRHQVVCSKCFWYKPDNYKDFFWWIELHKQAGYEKVFFCNNTIPNTKEFNEIVDANKDFIEISQLNYLPNFIETNRSAKVHTYLNYFEQMGSYFHVESDLFNMMMTNECFLNNTDKYSHVSVFDNDESIMPRVNSKLRKTSDNFKFVSKLKFENKIVPEELIHLDMSCSNDMENKLDSYFRNFTTKASSFHFGMGFYLNDKQVKQIVEGIEAYFNKMSSLNTDIVHKIFIYDQIPASKDHNVYNFTFVLKNQDEINYAINLCKIYRFLIGEFEKENSDELQKYSKRFHRFFYIGGSLSSFACGKSMYSTDVAFEFTVHYPDYNKNYPHQAEMHGIYYDDGQLSHFRHVTEFHKSNHKEVSIKELILDLNYLICFYKPIIEKFSKIKLF